MPLLGILLASVSPAGGCSCNEELLKPCPAEFTVGELCPQVGMVCPWPGSKCGASTCTCVSQAGGFYWKCHSSWCTCTCPCGYTARTSCDTLECDAEPDAPCPPAAANICEVVCMPPDAGVDRGRPDVRPDLPRDGPTEAGDGPREAAPDQAGERAPDGPDLDLK